MIGKNVIQHPGTENLVCQFQQDVLIILSVLPLIILSVLQRIVSGVGHLAIV